MIIYKSLEEIKSMPETCVALGNFDGVHLGHRAIIEETVKRTAQLRRQSIDVKSAVFTFSNNPRNLIPGKKPVKNIIYQEEKAALLEKLGIDYLIDVPFTEEIMSMQPEAYVRGILMEKLHAREVFCGFNHHFGYRAAGNTELLKCMGEKTGFNVNEMKPVYVDSEVVSSTLIRTLIQAGEMDECARFLGRNYDIAGEVVVGNRLGKSLGFPTSNIMIDETMVTPPNGVYITYCLYNGVRYPSITNVGVKPTIGTFTKNMETHIFNFDKELYGKMIKVEFVRKTRDEVKFSSREELSEQIARDCNEAKSYHGI